MNQVVKFERTKKQRLNWEQEEDLRIKRANERKRRDLKKVGHDVWETNDEQ